MFVEKIVSSLMPLANPVQAKKMAAYMRNQFDFLGVPSPARRLATKVLIKNFADFTEDISVVVDKLWLLKEREYQYVACDLLQRHGRHLLGAHLPELKRWVQEKSWWDTVDGLALVVGEVVFRDRCLVSHMDALINTDNFWLRRVAILHQLKWKTETDHERLFSYCLQCAGESEFFIRKAIGWALRQYARTNSDLVREFLKTHQTRLSFLSMREASRHL